MQLASKLSLSLLLTTALAPAGAQRPNWYGDYWVYRYQCANGRRHWPDHAQAPLPYYTSCAALRDFIERHACQNQGLTAWDCGRTSSASWWLSPSFGEPVAVARNLRVLTSRTRLQQIQAPIRAGAITQIGLVPDESISSVGGTIDLEVFMSHAPRGYRGASVTFAGNRGADFIQVVGRRTLTYGAPRVGTASPVPGDPLIPITLDIPFLHDGVADLMIEFVVHANSGVLAVDQVWAGQPNEWGFFAVGEGCESNGSRLTSTVRGSTSPSAVYSLNTTIVGAAANAPGVIILGPAMPPTPVPGACGSLMTQPLATVLVDTGNGSVAHTLTAPSSLSAAGLQLGVQAAVFDPASARLGFSNSTTLQVGELLPADIGGVTVEGGLTASTGHLRSMVVGWAYR